MFVNHHIESLQFVRLEGMTEQWRLTVIAMEADRHIAVVVRRWRLVHCTQADAVPYTCIKSEDSMQGERCQHETTCRDA